MRESIATKFTGELEVWLSWVIKIRFVIISFVFAIDYSIRQFAPSPANFSSIKYLGVAVILWYTLNIYYLMYNQLGRDYLLQAYLQLFCDVVVITAIVHVTGDLDSNYLSLYLVAIILASILLPRGGAFLVAAASFVLMGSVLELAYLPSLYPAFARRYPAFGFLATSSLLPVDLETLQVKIFASLFGFLAVAYLSGYLAETLREAGQALKDKAGQVANLQAMNENIIRSMLDGLITTDLQGMIIALNPAGAAMLGRDSVEVMGRPMETIFGDDVEDDGSRESSSLRVRREITYLHPRGEHRILGITGSRLVMPEIGVVGRVYNLQDLTEEKRREADYRAKDRLAALGHLAAGIAHEIRNPLASIAGSVKLLGSITALDDDQAKLIAIVSQESERLNKLVSDFLVYSRKQRFEFREVDLVKLLEETLLLVEHHPLFGVGCRLERKLPARPVVASADPDKLRQVFWNICDNSLKAMPQGGTLTAEIMECHDRSVQVVLADTGVGFTSNQLEKVFEPFQSGFAHGTGLGLAIVYQIIQGHQGEVRVDSVLGKGSRFSIRLPRAEVQAPSDPGRTVGRGFFEPSHSDSAEG
jgi:two-component system sensor histidine kinase PilS (NtrC family)